MKRHHIITVIILSLLAPQVATALLRPEGAIQSKPEQQVCYEPEEGKPAECNVIVPSWTPSGKQTPRLTRDRSFRVEVTGVWYPEGTSNPNFKADARCVTTDGVNWRPGDQYIEIQNTSRRAVTSSDCRSDHKYNFQVIGTATGINSPGEKIMVIDINYGDNQGTLNAKVWAQNEVTWNMVLGVPIGTSVPPTPEIGRFEFGDTAVSQTVTASPSIPELGTPPIDTGLPELLRIDVRLEGNKCSGGATQFSIAVTVTGIPIGSTPAQCIFNVGSAVDPVKPYWNTTGTAVGGTIPGRRISDGGPITTATVHPCDALKTYVWDPVFGSQFWQGGKSDRQNCTFIVREAQPERSFGEMFPTVCNGVVGTLVCNAVAPGSSVGVKMSWSADTSKLYKTIINDKNENTGAETTAVWSPYHPTTEYNWFITDAAAGKLNAEFKVFLYGPGGVTIFESSSIAIQGLGQWLEAAFTTKVAGF